MKVKELKRRLEEFERLENELKALRRIETSVRNEISEVLYKMIFFDADKK